LTTAIAFSTTLAIFLLVLVINIHNFSLHTQPISKSPKEANPALIDNKCTTKLTVTVLARQELLVDAYNFGNPDILEKFISKKRLKPQYTPLENTFVEIFDGELPVQSQRTDADGIAAFFLKNLKSVKVKSSHDNYQPYFKSIEIIDGQEYIEIHLDYVPDILKGQVRYQGLPVQGVNIEINNHRSLSDKSGSFMESVSDIKEDLFSVRMSKVGFKKITFLLKTSMVDSAVVFIFRLRKSDDVDMSWVRVQLVDESERPCTDIKCKLTSRNREKYQINTDNNGIFIFLANIGTSYDLRIISKDYGFFGTYYSDRKTIKFRKEEKYDVIVLSLARKKTVKIFVTDEANAPVNNCVINIEFPHLPNYKSETFVRTDEDGVAEIIYSRFIGEVEILPVEPGYSAIKKVFNFDRLPNEIKFKLRVANSKIILNIQDIKGFPINKIAISILLSRNTIGSIKPKILFKKNWLYGKDGLFLIESLPFGSYLVLIFALGYNHYMGELSASEDPTQNDVQLSPCSNILECNVFEKPTGEQVKYFLLKAEPLTWGSDWTGTSIFIYSKRIDLKNNGKFQLKLPSGKYRIEVFGKDEVEKNLRKGIFIIHRKYLHYEKEIRVPGSINIGLITNEESRAYFEKKNN